MKTANIPVYGNIAVYIYNIAVYIQYCGVYTILRCLSKNRLYTKMLRIHLFSIFTIKTPQALTALASIVKTLTNVLITITRILPEENKSTALMM